MTNFQIILLSSIAGITIGTILATAMNVMAIKRHTETFMDYKVKMDELALDVWCKPLKNAQNK